MSLCNHQNLDFCWNIKKQIPDRNLRISLLCNGQQARLPDQLQPGNEFNRHLGLHTSGLVLNLNFPQFFGQFAVYYYSFYLAFLCVNTHLYQHFRDSELISEFTQVFYKSTLLNGISSLGLQTIVSKFDFHWVTIVLALCLVNNSYHENVWILWIFYEKNKTKAQKRNACM